MKRLASLVAFLAIPLCVVLVSQAAAPARTIAADLGKVRGALNTQFKVCVGAGRANEGLRADWQRQLKRVREECGFTYLRFHGLFTDDMGVYRENKNGTPSYNWQYIDELFDFLQSIGMKPFVELGFMPGALASGPQTIFWWKGNTTPPKDYAKWEALVRTFVEHVTERYGSEEVKTWYFEVWNEPNLSGFFSGTQADYFKLYETSARAIKGVNPAYRVGGPATAGAAWVPETLEFCARNRVPIDFVSTHTYATESGYLDADGSAGTVMSANPKAVTDEVRRSRQQISESAFPKAELHYTEWSSSYTPADPVHDSYHSAAFILDKIKGVGDAATSMSYWTFTDIFEEAGPRFTPFHGGFGLLNTQGIPKASYYAYRFLNQLGPKELVSADPASFVCSDDQGGIQALIWDYTLTHPGPSIINQDYYKKDLPPSKTTQTKLQLGHIAPGNYSLEVFKVGYRVNDAYATYRDLGAPAQLTWADMGKIRKVNDGSAIVREEITISAEGNFARDFELRENDVILVVLKRR